MAEGYQNVVVGLNTMSSYTGDLNDMPSGVFTVDSRQGSTNLPNSTNLAWVVLCCNETIGSSNYYAMQIAIGYQPSDVYARRKWATWEPWVKLN